MFFTLRDSFAGLFGFFFSLSLSATPKTFFFFSVGGVWANVGSLSRSPLYRDWPSQPLSYAFLLLFLVSFSFFFARFFLPFPRLRKRTILEPSLICFCIFGSLPVLTLRLELPAHALRFRVCAVFLLRYEIARSLGSPLVSVGPGPSIFCKIPFPFSACLLFSFLALRLWVHLAVYLFPSTVGLNPFPVFYFFKGPRRLNHCLLSCAPSTQSPLALSFFCLGFLNSGTKTFPETGFLVFYLQGIPLSPPRFLWFAFDLPRLNQYFPPVCLVAFPHSKGRFVLHFPAHRVMDAPCCCDPLISPIFFMAFGLLPLLPLV